ncbi:MAG: hypothetical protein ACJAV1_002064, partial [Paraglaciecola sp.]
AKPTVTPTNKPPPAITPAVRNALLVNLPIFCSPVLFA